MPHCCFQGLLREGGQRRQGYVGQELSECQESMVDVGPRGGVDMDLRGRLGGLPREGIEKRMRGWRETHLERRGTEVPGRRGAGGKHGVAGPWRGGGKAHRCWTAERRER